MTQVQKFCNGVVEIIFMKKEITTTVEITDSYVKVLQSKFLKGKNIICACDIREIRHYTDEEIGKLLRDALLSKNFNQDELIFSIPRRFAILKRMRLPSVNESEIRKMISLQLVNKIPYSPQDVIFEPYILEKEKSGYCKVLVIIVHKEVVDRYLKIFEKIGITLSKLTLSSMGLLNWHLYQEGKKKKEVEGSIILVNIDALHTEICFCGNDKLLFSRSINCGAKDMSADGTTELFNQIRLSLSAFQKENMGHVAEKIIVLSSLREALFLSDKLEKELNIRACVAASFENVMCLKNINLSTFKNKPGISLAVGLGILLSNIKNLINLTPQEVRNTKKIRQRKIQWLKFIFLFLFVFVLGISILGIELYQKDFYLKRLENRIGQVRPEVKVAQEKRITVKALEKEFENRIFIPDIINKLYDVTPNEISFRSLYLDDRGRFTMQGYAHASNSVNILRENLIKAEAFYDVNLQFATKRRLFKTEVTDFKIITELIKSGG